MVKEEGEVGCREEAIEVERKAATREESLDSEVNWAECVEDYSEADHTDSEVVKED